MSVSIRKTTFIAILAVLALSACSENKTEETAGEKLDKAVEVTKQKATEVKEQAGEVYSDAAEATVEAYDVTKEKAAELVDDGKELSVEAKQKLKEACEKAKEKLGTEDKDC
jgi:gas vesicle protein